MAAEILDVPVDRLTIAEREALPHQGNRLFDVWLGSTHLIAKVFCHPDPGRRLVSAEREHNALQLLHSTLLAPGPRGFRGGPHPVVVYDYVPGSMWDRQPPSPFQLYHLAEPWLRLTEIPPAGLWLAQGQEQSWSDIESLLRSRVQAYADWVVAADPQRAETATLCVHATDRIFSAIKPLSGLRVVRQLGHWDRPEPVPTAGSLVRRLLDLLAGSPPGRRCCAASSGPT